jgi:UDP-glucose 4-epimerase
LPFANRRNEGMGKNSQRLMLYEIVARRAGDIAQCWADPSYAEKVLGWRAQRGLEAICTDSRHWQQQHTKGFK